MVALRLALGILVLVVAGSKADTVPGTAQQDLLFQARAFDITPDGKQILIGYSNFTPEGLAGKAPSLRLWDATTGKVIRHFIGPKAETNYVAFVSGDKQLVSGFTFDAVHSWICVWDLASGKKHRSFAPTIKDGYFAAAVSPDGKQLVTWETNRTVNHLVVWGLATGDKIKTIAVKKRASAYRVQISPSGRFALLMEGFPWEMTLIDLSTGEVSREFKASKKENLYPCAAFSSDGRLLLFSQQVLVDKSRGTYQPFLVLWDVVKSEERNRFPCKAGCSDVLLSPDGKMAASHEGMLRLWDLTNGKEMWSFAGSIRRFSFSPDSKEIFVFDGSNLKPDQVKLMIFQAKNGKMVRRLILSPPR